MTYRSSRLRDKLLSGLLTASMVVGMLPAVTVGAGAAYDENRAGKMQLSEEVFSFTSSSDKNPDKPYIIENGNIVRLGTPDYEWDQVEAAMNENILAVSQYPISFNQNFTLSGTFNDHELPQGFTVTFQPDPNLTLATGHNMNLGVYGKAVDALVVEVDTWGHGSENAFVGDDATGGAGKNGTHLGINTLRRNSSGQIMPNILATTLAGNALLTSDTLEYVLTWDSAAKKITLKCGTYTVQASFDPEAFWGQQPVYFSLSAGLYQAGHDNERKCGTFDLTIDSFTYTNLTPEEEVKYIVHRGGVTSEATDVTYDVSDQSTWPMPGDTVEAVHTLWNTKDRVALPVEQAVYVPVARVNGSAVTPTGLSGTTGNTDIFNETRRGSAISTATFSYPQTNLTERKADMSYTYVLPAGLKVDSDSKIDDVLVVGAPFMTQYTYVSEVKLASKPTLAGVKNMQVAVGYGDGTFDLKDGVTSTAFDGTDVTGQVTIKDENGREITELSTQDAGTYKVYYTAKDNRLYNEAEYTVERLITIVDGTPSEDNQYAISADNFTLYLSQCPTFTKNELVEKSNAIGYEPDGNTNSSPNRFVVSKVNGVETDNLDTIVNAKTSQAVEVEFYYRSGNEATARAYKTITIIDDNANVSQDQKNSVNAKDLALKAEEAKTLFEGDLDAIKAALIKEMEAIGYSQGAETDVSVVFGTSLDPDLIQKGEQGTYNITFTVGNPGINLASKTVKLTIIDDSAATSPDGRNYTVSATGKVIRVSDGAKITTGTALIALLQAEGYENGVNVIPNYEFLDGASLSSLATQGTYQVKVYVGTPGTDNCAEQTVTIQVVDDDEVVNGNNSVTAIDVAYTQAEAAEKFAGVTESTFADKLIELMQASGVENGVTVTPTVDFDAGVDQAILEGVLGTYRITFSTGSGVEKASKTVNLTIAEEGVTIKGTSTVTALPKIVNSTKAQTLTTTKLIGELMEASGTRNGAVSTVGIKEKNGNSDYKTGVVGNYTFTFAVGSASDPDNYAVRDVILKVVSDDAIVAADWTAYVDGKDGDILDSVAKKLTDKKELAKFVSFEGADTKYAKLNELTPSDTDSFDVIVSDEDWAAIQAGTEGTYQVTLKVGSVEKTVTLTMRLSMPVANDDGSISVPGKDGMTGTQDDVKVVPEPAPMTKDQLENMIKPDGSVKVESPATGGTVTLPGADGVTGNEDDLKVTVEGPFTVKPDGTIVLPEGSTGEITKPDGSKEPVTGPAVIDPDGNVNTDVSSGPEVDGSDNTDPDGKKDGSITLPGVDEVVGTNDDVTVIPAPAPMTQEELENMIQPDGSVKVEEPATGDTVKLPGQDGANDTDDDKTVNVTGPFVVKPDGTILIPSGSTGEIVDKDGNKTSVPGPAVIDPYGNVKTDVSEKPEVDGGDNTDPDGKKDGSIALPGKDGMTGTEDDVKVVPNPAPMTEKELEDMIQPNGSVKVDTPATGGTVTLPGEDGKTGNEDDLKVTVEGSFTVKPDGTIVLPEGSTGEITKPDGSKTPVTGPAVIDPDGNVNTDVSSGPEVDGSDNTDPDGKKDGSITLPGRDEVVGTGDDVTVIPDPAPMTQEQLENMIQPDGSVKVEEPATGGTVKLPGDDGTNGTKDDKKVTITGPFTVMPDGTIILPEGSTGEIEDENGNKTPVTGPVIITPEGKPAKPIPTPDGEDDPVIFGQTVQLDPNGGTFPNDGGSDPITLTVDADTNFADYQPTRGGYNFKGWEKVSAPDGVDVAYRAVWSSTGGGGGGSVTTEYTLTYESNGGTVFAAEKYKSGTEVKLTKTPRRDGYIFTGWYSDAKLTQRVTSVTMRKNVTVYAGWDKVEISDLLNTKDHMAYFFGYDDGLVHPTDNITRGQTALVLFRLLNEEHRATILTSENNFPDVDSSSWYNEAVSTLANGGYINGLPDGTFGGDNTITRMEFVAMLVRVLGVDETAECNYSDVGRDHWAYRYIATASQAGWVNGIGDGTFRPEQAITRAEAMTILNRILNRGVDENSDIDGHKTWTDNQPGTWYYYEVIEATTSHEYTGSRPSEDWTHVSQD